MPAVVVRPAGRADVPFLTEMLVAAASWRPDGPFGALEDVLGNPALAHYVAGWPRPGELGVVAEAGDPVGAAWLRFLPAHDPGYGFVGAAIPEVAMGVAAPWRGRGIGTCLLGSLVDAARRSGLAALSLSVESDNGARRLYERHGFGPVGAAGGAETMLLRL